MAKRNEQVSRIKKMKEKLSRCIKKAAKAKPGEGMEVLAEELKK